MPGVNFINIFNTFFRFTYFGINTEDMVSTLNRFFTLAHMQRRFYIRLGKKSGQNRKQCNKYSNDIVISVRSPKVLTK